MDEVFTAIDDYFDYDDRLTLATSMSYTPTSMDVSYHLRATATYTDPLGSGKTARAVSAGPQTDYTVTASDNPGPYIFSGVLENEDKSETTVGGALTIAVGPPDCQVRRQRQRHD